MADHVEADIQLCKAIQARGYVISTIYDVGSSSGAWSMRVAAVFPEARFELFEPLWNSEPNYKLSRETLKTSLSSCRISPYALGEMDGEVDIHVFPDVTASTTLPLDEREGVKRIRAPMRSIDSLVESREYPPPDLMKLDMQGGELAALKGAVKTLPQCQFILAKCWLQRAYGSSTPLLSDLMDLLLPLQFYPYDVANPYRNPSSECIALEVAFINKRTARPGVFL